MAVVARPPVATGSNSLKAALIAFVCLTVASLGGFVYLFTLQSDLEKRATDKEAQAATAMKTADEANQQLSAFAKDVVGKATNSPADIQKEMDTVRADLARDNRLKIRPNMALTEALRQLKAEYDNTAKRLAETTAERDKLNADFVALNKAAQEGEQSFKTQLGKLQTKYQTLETTTAAARTAWTKNLSELNTKLTAAADVASKHLGSEREKVTNLTEQLTHRDERIQDLRDKLASFRPSADQNAAIQVADGTIVRLIPGQDIAYISLGSSDRIRPGMSFSVYSRYRGIPADGKGKATLEVTQVFDTTSEARVLSTTPGDPVVENDIIANPIYDRSRQFNFVVAGDFDLDFDGTIEDPGGQQVARMIEAWGGKLVKTVDSRADFVVLGVPPAPPSRGPAMDADTAAAHKAEYEAQLRAFEAMKTEARALSIPVLTRIQFLNYVGRPVPKNAKDSEGA